MPFWLRRALAAALVAKGWPVEKVRERVADPCCRRRPDRHYGRKDERARAGGTSVYYTLRGRSWRCTWRFAAASCTSSSASSQRLAAHGQGLVWVEWESLGVGASILAPRYLLGRRPWSSISTTPGSPPAEVQVSLYLDEVPPPRRWSS